MPSTFTGSGIELIADGEQSGVWGQTTNDNLQIINRLVSEAGSIALSGTTHTLTIADGSLSDGQYGVLVFGGSPSGTNTVTVSPNDAKRIFIVKNGTSESVVLTQGSGGNVTIPASAFKIVYTDGGGAGAEVVDVTSVAAFTTVNATTLDTTNIEVTNIKAKDGTASATIADSTGVMTVASSVLTTTDINGGTIDGTTIGGASAAAGTFTTATATTGNITTVNATTVDTTNIEVTNIKAKDGTAAGSIADATGVVTLASSVLTTTDINGGTIDGTVIGGSTPAAITGTTGSFSGNLTVDTDTLLVDAANNRVGIGTSSPTDGKLVITGASVTTAQGIRLTGDTADARFICESASLGAGILGTFSNHPQLFYTNSTERARIDASGTLIHKLAATFNEDGADADFRVESDTDTHMLFVDASANAVGIGLSNPGVPLHVKGPTNGNVMIVDATGTAANYIFDVRDDNTSVMRVDPSGNLLVGKTSASATLDVKTTLNQQVARISLDASSSTATPAVVIAKKDNDSTTSQVFVQFLINSEGAGSGQINANGGNSAAFGSYSDERLKENIVDLPAQLENICSLRPVEFDYKAGGHQIGFIAQEMQAVYPDVVGSGSDDMLTITGWSKTEARLVKALQEAVQKIEALEARITALEGTSA